jgi:4a-hydroxytetrahydrobiopterin dehydratase
MITMPLSEEQVRRELLDLDDWSFSDDKLHRSYKFEDFKTAMSFMVRVGFEAENQRHHPELFNVYNQVKISLTTHDAGDKITTKDIKLAKAIELVYKTF